MYCIIPARKGSVGIKNKNIKIIKSKPLIFHTIDHAIKSKKISKIIVNTNDNRIIRMVNKTYNNRVEIFKRPNFLSKSDSSAIDVYIHCISKLNSNGNNIKNFCVLLPTSPLRNYKDIDKAINLYLKKKAKVVLSVSKNYPLEYLFKISKKQKLEKYRFINNSILNRQKLKYSFRGNGSIYILNYKNLKKQKTYFTNKTYCYEINKLEDLDIDDSMDFKIAKKLIR